MSLCPVELKNPVNLVAMKNLASELEDSGERRAAGVTSVSWQNDKTFWREDSP